MNSAVETIAETHPHDLLQLCRRRYLAFIVAFGVCLTSAALLISNLRQEWGATFIIKIGRVGNVTDLPQRPIETVPVLAERIKTVSFRRTIAPNSIVPIPISVESLSDDMLKLSTRAPTSEAAVNLAESIWASVQKTHDEMFDKLARGPRLRLEQTERDLNDLRKILLASSGVDGLQTDPGPSSSHPSEQINYEIRDLRNRALLFSERLGPTITYPTSLVGSFEASDKPVTPSKSMLLAIAIAASAAVGIFTMLVVDYVKRSQQL